MAITRATTEVGVFASFDPGMIDLTRSQAAAVRDLKTYLDFAARGTVALGEAVRRAGTEDYANDFEQSIAEMLRATEIPFCVASSSDVARIRLSLGVSGLLPHFEGRIFSSSMVKRGKPAPDLFLHAAAQLGAAPSDCVVFEDSIAGITAAKAAGMYPVGYLGGGHLPADHAKKLSAAGAKAIISDWSEAPALIAGLG